jgi:hypothetical protein
MVPDTGTVQLLYAFPRRLMTKMTSHEEPDASRSQHSVTGARKPALRATTRFSPVAAEQLGHGFLMRDRARPTGSHPRAGRRGIPDEDETGYVWTFLDEARDPGQIKPGAIIVAGDQDAAAVCEVIDLAPAGDGIIVHLRLLPGLVEDYRALVERALAS